MIIHESDNCEIHRFGKICVKSFKKQDIFRDASMRFWDKTIGMNHVLPVLLRGENEIVYSYHDRVLIDNISSLTPDQKMHVYKRVCETAYKLFQRNICHGDIIVTNIFIDSKNDPYLFDPFGTDIPLNVPFHDSEDCYCLPSGSIHAGKENKPCLKLLQRELGLDLDPYEYICSIIRDKIFACSGSENYADMKDQTYTSYENKHFKLNGWRNTAERIAMFQKDGVGIEGKKILDIGSNCGAISLYLAELGAKVTGIEINKDRVEVSTELNRFLGLDAEFKAGNLIDHVQNQTYDICCCFAVTGRNPNEIGVLRKIYDHSTEILFESNHSPNDDFTNMFKSIGYTTINHLGSTSGFPIRHSYHCSKTPKLS